MRIAFRVDSSSAIGSGHFMRCLTLADSLRNTASETCFVVRSLPDHLRVILDERGYGCVYLKTPDGVRPDSSPKHSSWLGVPQNLDARQTIDSLGNAMWDWMVVDHYGIDASWETALRQICRHILVIDDLADRPHDCDALIDQNLHPDTDARYAGLVPTNCKLFLGPQYAFLRDEFHRQREKLRERSGDVRNILIYFGGVDADNHTLAALEALHRTGIEVAEVNVVIGTEHPDSENIQDRCRALGYRCHVQTSEMARLMAAADLAIGAGGISCYERLYLRLPSILRPIADNQVEQLNCMAATGLCETYSDDEELTDKLRKMLTAKLAAPEDCVAGDNRAVSDYLLPQGRRHTPSK